MFRNVAQDARELRRLIEASGNPPRRKLEHLTYDGFTILLLTRMRESVRRLRIPLLNRFLRRIQLALFGIDLGNAIELGHGVHFVHPVGIVIGGTARIGRRVTFMGGNTVGTAKDNGYPIIEDDVVVGCGARILGPVRIGQRAVIGANAVVLRDVPADCVATGVPAQVRPRR